MHELGIDICIKIILMLIQNIRILFTSLWLVFLILRFFRKKKLMSNFLTLSLIFGKKNVSFMVIIFFIFFNYLFF